MAPLPSCKCVFCKRKDAKIFDRVINFIILYGFLVLVVVLSNLLCNCSNYFDKVDPNIYNSKDCEEICNIIWEEGYVNLEFYSCTRWTGEKIWECDCTKFKKVLK